MKALVYDRDPGRFVLARLASELGPASAVRRSPLTYRDIDEPSLPGPGWVRLRPRLAGICGSDLATVQSRSSRYFESIVSFPFVPGHELVADQLDPDGSPTRRVVLQPVLGCEARSEVPPCPACAVGQIGNCERVSFGHLSAGLQTGYCRDTGGGWATELVAHQSQLYDVPPDFSDEMAVMVEPAACGVHAALAGIARVGESASVAVVGSGTLGLCVLAAVRQYGLPAHLMAVAKHPVQQTLAKDLGADTVLPPSELSRGARRITRSLRAGRQLTSGMDLVIDCVGSSSSLADALEIVRPRGTVIMAGMPGRVSVDLASMWHREVAVVGAYTYGLESRPRAATSFELAFELVEAAGLGRLVSGRYPLDRYVEALEHAGQAGQRGAIKVVFDLTKARVGAVSSPRGTLR